MKSLAYSNKYPSLSITYIFIFCIGLACMTVSGYFLIEGLSQFAGSGAAKKVLIIGGILFQITESICFIAASALTYHSLRWRYILFSLGVVLFSFSIGIMTLAQKTALQTGEAQAQAIDEKRQHIRSQIASLQQVIDSYRFNAEKQSKSIYKDSRAMGQDSINRAAQLEEKKIQLSEQLYGLNIARRQTSSDFFNQLEQVTGLPQKSTEFYFLVLRSLLLELSGIILMSFGANLRAYNKLVVESGAQTDLQTKKPLLKKLFSSSENRQPAAATDAMPQQEPRPPITQETPNTAKTDKSKPAYKQVEIPFQSSGEVKSKNKRSTDSHKSPEEKIRDVNKVEYWQSPNLKESSVAATDTMTKSATTTRSNSTGHHLGYLATMVMDLYEQQLLPELNAGAIKDSLSRYCSENISQDTAGILSKMINARLDESC